MLKGISNNINLTVKYCYKHFLILLQFVYVVIDNIQTAKIDAIFLFVNEVCVFNISICYEILKIISASKFWLLKYFF